MYKDCNIKIIRKKIKNTYIRVKNKEIIVTTNYLTPKIYIMKLIKDNSKSIDKMIIQDEKRNNKNDDFYLFGVKYDIIYDDSIKDIVIDNSRIIVKDETTYSLAIENVSISSSTIRSN